MKYLLIIAILLLAARPASACLNDRDVASAENEFRSAYLLPAESSQAAVPGWHLPSGGAIAAAVGAMLTLGSSVVLLKKHRRFRVEQDVQLYS